MECVTSIMTNNLIVKSSILSLPEEIESHLFGFLTTSLLAKYNETNSETHKKTKACVFLRRIHTMVREYSWFDNCKFQWNVEREHNVITSIRDKLVNDIGCRPGFAEVMDTNSLIDFNRSIDWLDNYHTDDEFIDMLLSRRGDCHFWTNHEQFYIDKWYYEFKDCVNMWRRSEHVDNLGLVGHRR